MCRHLRNCNIDLCPDQCLVSVRFLHGAIMDCYSIQCIFSGRLVLFRSIGVIAHVFCPADVLVCWFVVTVANFWYVVIAKSVIEF